jgi:predicted metal-dependent phosphoesterase TrpH
MRINLHCHSNKSDGVNTPASLIDILASNDLDIVSLTDHDSISGIEEAKICCINKGITLIPVLNFQPLLRNLLYRSRPSIQPAIFWRMALMSR